MKGEKCLHLGFHLFYKILPTLGEEGKRKKKIFPDFIYYDMK